jgi:hypothetical protein
VALRPFALALFLTLASCSGGPVFHRWHKVELTFHGPLLRSAEDPNPFAVPLDVHFEDSEGTRFKVPGFYDGDGGGGPDGNVWKARFSADRNGIWKWRTSSPERLLDGKSGTFRVNDPPPTAPDLYRFGRLEFVGGRYLKFRDGGIWLKAGADEPENLLGDAFGRDRWDAKKEQVDYLARSGINSMYIMTHTLDGDGKDVWPWLGETAEEAKANPDRFDVGRLQRWLELFEYIQSRGIVIHLVLEDDSAWTGFDYPAYYREIVARFGHLPALIFNYCEEYNERHSLGEALDHMKLLSEIDPYQHPRAIHNVNAPNDEFLASSYVNVASIQTPPSSPRVLNALAIEWLQAPLATNRRPLVVGFDEGRPADERRSWWSVYMGGGNWESYIPVPAGYSATEPAWRELALAHRFFVGLPLEKMVPANHLVTDGSAFCLAQPPAVYAFYLLEAGTIEAVLPAGNRYRTEWYDPRGEGEAPWRKGPVIDGGRQKLEAPGAGDWAARVTQIEGTAPAPPIALSAKLASRLNQPVTVRLVSFQDGEVRGSAFEILDPPKNGSLGGEGSVRVYAPRTGFTGHDEFTWRVRSDSGLSNPGRVVVVSNATGINQPPRVENQLIHAAKNTAALISLRYSDGDGPGPYRITIRRQPANGSLRGLDNDVIYEPTPGFSGSDFFEWDVHDGEARSNRARVTISVR